MIDSRAEKATAISTMIALVFSLVLLFVLAPVSTRFFEIKTDFDLHMSWMQQHLLGGNYSWYIYVLGITCLLYDPLVGRLEKLALRIARFGFASLASFINDRAQTLRRYQHGFNVVYIIFMSLLTLCWVHAVYSSIVRAYQLT